MGKMRDLTGQRFGKLVVLECAGKLDGRRYSWKCQCDCGNTKIIAGASLTSGNTKSCGCGNKLALQKWNIEQSEKAKIQIGTKFGKLTVIEDLGFREQVKGHNRRWYKCQCDCGNIHEVMGNQLKQGQIISCGKCLSSKGEFLIQQILNNNNIIYNYDTTLPELIQETNRRLRFDFIIYDNNGSISRIIEFDGRQHKYGPDTNYWGHSIDTLDDIKERDNLKNQFCFNHNIPLVRIPYSKINNLTLEDLFGNNFLLKESDKKNEQD